MAQRLSSLPTAARPASRRGGHGQSLSQGFSLVELLIGVVVSLVVLGAAVNVLVRWVRGDVATQVELNRKDATNVVLGLIQTEVLNADRLEIPSQSPTAPSALGNCSSTPILILRGSSTDGSLDISYGLRPLANSQWRGPNQLVRCGLPYNSSGSLDTGQARSEQVVLDQIPNGGFTPTTTAVSGNSVTRSLNISLTSGGVASSVQVSLNNNPVYGLTTNLRSSSCTVANGGCLTADGNARHWVASVGNTITGAADIEDVIYFDDIFSAYTIGGSTGRCLNNDNASGNCTVNKGVNATITINSGNVLVFQDREIRLPNS